MTRNTYLSDSVEITVYESKYNAQAKLLLANKQVLARIMKETTKEFRDYTIEEIIECIEESPEVGTKNVYAGNSKKQKITGLPQESTIVDEGKVTYDVYFYARTHEQERVKIYLNIEAQKKYHVGYSLVARGIFYCSRMISEQMDSEFTAENYDGIKKVYSIWICMETPEKIANTITEYSVEPHDIHGRFDEKENYDLLSVIMVRLSKKENASNGNALIQMLTTLFSHKLDANEKKKILSEDYDMQMTEELEGGIYGMCNLGELVWERAHEEGMEKGIEEGRKKGIEKGIEIERCKTVRKLISCMSVEKIAQMLDFELETTKKIAQLINEYPDASDIQITEMM